MKDNHNSIEGLSLERKKKMLQSILESRISTESSDSWPLSVAQKSLLFLYQLNPLDSIYNTGFALNFHFEVKKESLIYALKRLNDRHELLSARFPQAVNPECIISRHSLSPEVIDVSHLTDTEIRTLVDTTHQMPFDLEKGPIVRCFLFVKSKEESVFLFSIHHIVYDDGSTNLLLKELIHFYLEDKNVSSPLTINPKPLQFIHYVKKEQIMQQSKAGSLDRDFWLKQFEKLESKARLKDYNYAEIGLKQDPGYLKFRIDGDIYLKLKNSAKEKSVTVFAWLLSVYKMLMHTYCAAEQVIIGIPVTGRNNLEFANTVGYFVNLLPVISSRASAGTFEDYLRESSASFLNVLNHKNYPLAWIAELAQLSGLSSNEPLINNVFNYIESPVISDTAFQGFLNANQIKISDFDLPAQIEAFDLNFECKNQGDFIHINCKYKRDKYSKQFIRSFFDHYLAYLTQSLKYPEWALEKFKPAITQDLGLYNDSNITRREKDPGINVSGRFSKIAKLYPDNIALIDHEGHISYQELDEKTNRLAGYLKQNERCANGSVIGIMTGRSSHMIIAFIGTLKCNCAYMPIDIDLPPDRINALLTASGCDIILTDADYFESKDVINAHMINLKTQAAEIDQYPADINIEASESDLAYIMFTSGSTGSPKGVMITNDNIINLNVNNRFFSAGVGDNFMLVSNYSFDGSTFEIFGALLNGAALTILTLEDIFDARLLIRHIEQKKINMAFLATALFNYLVDHDASFVKYFDTILIGGEAISPFHIERCLPFTKNKDVLVNGYGPTECTTFSVFHKISNSLVPGKPIPIGQPVDGAKAYILDDQLNHVPIGVKGKLYISGRGVGMGYVRDPELTAKKFIKSDNEIIYDTGDNVCMLPDGDIYYLGRSDYQLKFRGYRIEPGEIESAICKAANVKAAIVREEKNENNSFLMAYVESEHDLDVVKLESFLKEALPAYMIPACFKLIRSFPLTRNKKIDRQALFASEDFAYPSEELLSPTQGILIDIWKKYLKHEQIKIYDNFFELGGHSLMISQIVSEINEHFQIEIKLSDLFKNANIASVSILVDKAINNLKTHHKVPEIIKINRYDYIKK